jgi:hypothetical protein
MVAQYQVEQWEEEKGTKTILPPKKIYFGIQRKMKQMDTQFQTPTKDK